MEFDTISTSKKTIDSRYVRFRYLPYTSKLSLSIIISIRNTGMPGDGGRNAFDVSIHCEHFRENIVILVLDIEREWSSIWCRYFDTLWTFQRKHVHTSVGYRTRMEFDAISISKKTINTSSRYVRFRYLLNTSKLSLSIIISIRNTGDARGWRAKHVRYFDTLKRSRRCPTLLVYSSDQCWYAHVIPAILSELELLELYGTQKERRPLRGWLRPILRPPADVHPYYDACRIRLSYIGVRIYKVAPTTLTRIRRSVCIPYWCTKGPYIADQSAIFWLVFWGSSPLRSLPHPQLTFREKWCLYRVRVVFIEDIFPPILSICEICIKIRRRSVTMWIVTHY